MNMGIKGEFDDVIVIDDINFEVNLSEQNFEKLKFEAAVEMAETNEITEDGKIGVSHLLDYLSNNEKFCKEIYEELYEVA